MLEGLWALFIFFSGFLISASRDYQNPSQTSVDMPLIQNRWEEEFLKEVSMEKTAEQVNELETTGAFYTEQEMREKLGYKQPPSYAFDMISRRSFQNVNWGHVPFCQKAGCILY